jgi:predicted aldo/keto reductase-like oxidoreductase
MLYRKIGSTGYEASILSMGCMRPPMLEQKNPRKIYRKTEGCRREKALDLIKYAIGHG